jgi:hypothetical protein
MMEVDVPSNFDQLDFLSQLHLIFFALTVLHRLKNLKFNFWFFFINFLIVLLAVILLVYHITLIFLVYLFGLVPDVCSLVGLILIVQSISLNTHILI